MKIFFLENSEIEYDSNDRYENKIRGGESVLINLSEKMSSLGHEIHVFNKSKHNRKKINGVFWSNIDFLKNLNPCDCYRRIEGFMLICADFGLHFVLPLGYIFMCFFSLCSKHVFWSAL